MTDSVKIFRAFLSIGSNLGDKKANCERALEQIETNDIGRVLAVSNYYRTEPVDYTDQEWFVNAAAEIQTEMPPEKLLRALKKTERELGTVSKSVRFGPRVIDIDILLYDTLVVRTDELVIPHERMHERVFVLKPLCDINSEITHPVIHKTVGELLSETDDENQGIIPLDD